VNPLHYMKVRTTPVFRQTVDSTKELEPGSDQQSVKILLVEDDVQQLDLLTTLLGFDGIHAVPFACAAQALARISREFQCVVTDYHLGERRGCEIVRAASVLDIPTILITGAANRKEIARSVNLGAEFVLVKPYQPQDLVELIRKAVMKASVRGKVKSVIRSSGGTEGSASVFAALLSLFLSCVLVLIDYCLDYHQALAQAVER
jgi:two-component system chemotaxis response regulator CheY